MHQVGKKRREKRETLAGKTERLTVRTDQEGETELRSHCFGKVLSGHPREDGRPSFASTSEESVDRTKGASSKTWGLYNWRGEHTS